MSRRINIKDLYASLAAFRNRLGEVTNDALDKVQEPVACQAGCGYCCNYRIYLRPEEVFMIVDYVRANFTPDRSKVIREQISQNSKTLKKLSRHERLATNLECAFLQDNSCSIYEVRPDMCRVHFSSDVNMCIKSIENPEDQSIVHKVDFGLHSAVTSCCKNYKDLIESGYDQTRYEMNLALSVSLTDTKPLQRFIRKKRAYSSSISQSS